MSEYDEIDYLTPLDEKYYQEEDIYNYYDLDLSYRSITNIDFLSDNEDYNELEIIDLSDNYINDLTPLENLTNLTELYLGDNKIYDIEPLKKLKNLRVLDLSGNYIKDLRPLKSLTKITDLYLSKNEIIDIKPLKELQKLEILFLTNNKVKQLDAIESLKQLKEIYLENNDIISLLPIRKLNNLQVIKIFDNPLTYPPEVIARRGFKEITNYFEQSEQQGLLPLYEAKLLLVGEPGAGKTSLMNKLVDDSYIVPNDEDSTLGFNIYEGWKFPWDRDNEITFRTNIWDFGGQEIQYMLHQFFLTSRSLYVIVADDRKQHTRFDYWFNCIQLLGQNSPVIVVLNERDGNVISNFDYATYKSRYPELDITQYSVDLSDNDGRISILRKLIQKKLSNLKHIGDRLPQKWIPIRNDISNYNEKNHITYGEYIFICEQYGLKNETDQKIIIKALNDLGVLLYFENDPNLRDFVFLNPSWTMDAVYSVLSDTEIQKSKGKFKNDFLFKIWNKKYDYNEQRALFNLMLKDNFDLCYKDHDSELFLLPLLLPSIKPDYIWNNNNNLYFQLRYDFFPEGLMARLIVRLNKYIVNLNNKDLVWSGGVVIDHNFCKAEILTENYSGKQSICIKITGDSQTNKKSLLNVIINEIILLHNKTFSAIKYNEMYPCNCIECSNGEIPFFFDSKVLHKYYDRNIQEIRCDNSLELVDVISILDGIDFNTKRKKRTHMSNKGININVNPTITATATNTVDVKTDIDITIEIKNEIKLLDSLLNNLNEDIVDEIEIQELSQQDQKRCENDISKVNSAIKSLNDLKTKDELKVSPALNRISTFLTKLNDTSTTIGKVFSKVESGISVVQDIASTYNSIAEWCGLPVVPKLFLKKIKS